MIALVDYHAGNLTSVKKALAAVGADVFVPERPSDLQHAAAVIVPGVGHFGATRALDRAWVEAITERVEYRPLLGICLGMQWLFEASEEAPDLQGLGVMPGRCYRLGAVGLKTETTDGSAVRLKADTTYGSPVRLKADTTDESAVRLKAAAVIKVPHVGWNTLAVERDSWIAAGVPDRSQVYFTHSYVAPITGHVVAVTEHGEPFAAIVERGHVAGVQFHPEKSGEVGLRILRNFVERCRDTETQSKAQRTINTEITETQRSQRLEIACDSAATD